MKRPERDLRGQLLVGLRRRLAQLGVRAARIVVARGLQVEEIAPTVRIGAGVNGAGRVQFAGLNDVGAWTSFGHDISIGYGTTIGISCGLVGPIRIGDYCQLGPHVLVFGEDHPLDYFSTYTGKRLLQRALRPHMETAEVIIGHGVWIGTNAVVLRGTEIGNGSVVGAGAVVRGSFPANSLIVGNPARVVRERLPADLAELVDRTEWWTLRGDEQDVLRELADVNLRREPERGREVLGRLLDRLGHGPSPS